ncbi:MAG: RnfABCDGE type electron transport complex subunit B [Gammaproteobacteria bacterium]|nr:RnfABCDGE type electron transport complex subunit B [Gammaproteobacteria bacterium]
MFYSSVSANQIDQCLPQTQCTLCGYPRCWEYAKAISEGRADINQCPPGNTITISALAKLLGRPKIPLNEEHGIHEKKQVALIREADCIGCKLCIKVCPVNCIIGSEKLMHTVIAQQCTGCKLCIPVCPTDCIELLPAKTMDGSPSIWPDFTEEQVIRARKDVHQKLERENKLTSQHSVDMTPISRKRLQRTIRAAVQRKKTTRKDH